MPDRRRSDPPAAFFLHGVLWCGLCERSLVAVRLPDGSRNYGCRVGCVRVPIRAEVIERLVWHRFARLNDAYARGVAPDGRRDVLRRVLKRVVVSVNLDRLRYEWRD